MKMPRLPGSPGFNLIAGLISLLLLLVLIVFVARGKAKDISADIARKANLTLNERGLGGVMAKVDGRDVTLTGETSLDAARIQAADAISHVAGVRSIANRIEVNRTARARPSITGGRDRPAAPLVRPGVEQQRPRLGDSPSPQPSQITPPIKRTVTPEPVAPKPVITKPVITKPVVPRPVVRSVVEPKPVSVTPQPVRPKPVLPTPVRPAVSSPSVTARPAPVVPRPVLPKPVRPVIQPPAIKTTAPAPVVAPRVELKKEMVKSRLVAAAVPPKPYLLQLKVIDNQVTATGYLPSDAALSELEQRVTLKQPLSLKQADAPPLFLEATRFVAEAAKRLSQGTVRVADKQIRIEGWADGEVNAFIKELENFLPAGYAFSVQVNSSSKPKPTAQLPVAQAQVVETATLLPVESVPVEVVDNQQFVDQALECQSAVDAVMQGKVIAFKFASDALERSSEALLRDVAQAMNSCPSAYLYVIGHTDSIGTQERNQRLSQRRAASVRRYLVSQGVYDDLVVAEGRGELEPIFSNSTEDGRAGNRRIEFSVRSEPSL